MARFVPVDRETQYLFPPSVQEWLPEDHLARFIVEVVEQLDLSALEQSYAGRGSDAHHPAMLVALLLYGYATGIFSSRALERASYDSIAVRYITANTHPDHDTINSFRKRFLQQIAAIFVQVLGYAQEMGMLKLGTVSLDGTKVHANASRHKAMSYGYAKKLQAKLKAEVAALLKRAEAANARDLPDGLEYSGRVGPARTALGGHCRGQAEDRSAGQGRSRGGVRGQVGGARATGEEERQASRRAAADAAHGHDLGQGSSQLHR